MKKRLFSFLLGLAMLVSLLSPAAATPALAADANAGDTVVTFTSDVHHISTKDDASANRLKNWLSFVPTEYGPVDVLGVCGDLAPIP